MNDFVEDALDRRRLATHVHERSGLPGHAPEPAGPPAAFDAARVLALQASTGNRAVAQLLHETARGVPQAVGAGPGRPEPRATTPPELVVEDGSVSLRAVVPRVPAGRADVHPAPVLVGPGGGAHADAMPGAPAEVGTAELRATPAPRPTVAEPPVGGSVTLPDVVLPGREVEERDSVAGALTYGSTITQTGPEPADSFGSTLPYDFTMQGITVTRAPGAYTVTATVRNPIVFQVRSSTGPDGQVDIGSDSDPDIDSGNYTQVVADLTPNPGDLNGRSPRTQFFARDLTVVHERFHATEGAGHARSGVTVAQNWLGTQTAGSVADVHALVAQVPARVIEVRRAAMTYPGREERAYADGAPLYTARANAIKAKGDAGTYPMSRGSRTAVGAGTGALVGAGIGAWVGGPVGAGVGAALGAVAGGLIGFFG